MKTILTILCIICILVAIHKSVNYLQYKKQIYLQSVCEEFNIPENDNDSDMLKYDLINGIFVIPQYVIMDNKSMDKLEKKLESLYNTDKLKIEIKDYIGDYKLMCVEILTQ